MPVTLTVREVRDALFRAGGRPGEACGSAASTPVLGRLFHEVFAELIGPDPSRNLRATLTDADPAGRGRALAAFAYEHHVGPRLTRDRAHLHHVAALVPPFWEAVRQLCDWLAALPEIETLARAEEPLSLELREPGWTDAVRLTGIADAIVRAPDGSGWCVVELKLGRTSPEADVAQAFLYHQMLAAGGPGPGTLALVSFGPTRGERLFSTGELESARPALLDLVGRLAGVLPPAEERPEAARRTEPDAANLELGRRLVAALAEYGVPVAHDGPPIVGPTFIRFPVAPGKGVKLSALQNRAPELQIRLGLARAPRIAIAGHRVVVDIQRPDRQVVPFAAVLGQLAPADPVAGNSRLPVGVDLDGRLVAADLAEPEHAHVLVAGTTGSGKSEWLRAAVAGLIAANTPATLRLVLIDPKRNAFAWLRDSPFLYAPIVFPDEQSAAGVLAGLADEMERRYLLLAESGSDDLAEHVHRTGEPIPRIVCVCDEYADLLLRDKEERKRLEHQIFRLGAKARAAGIHLLLATQQPSREVVKGALDANIPARVALMMNSPIESRMILNQPGAETLLGRGDLLFKGLAEPVRLQSAFLTPGDRERLAQASYSALSR